MTMTKTAETTLVAPEGDANTEGECVADEALSPTIDSELPNDGDDDNVSKQARKISLQELVYGSASFHAVVKPVSVTITLAALSVIYINTPASQAAGRQALQFYEFVGSASDDQSAATNLGLSLSNSLILVCGIGAMTFIMVTLYKYKCMKLLIGYMVLASTMLLGVLGGQMFLVAVNKYRLTIDQISFYLTMYNFAIVGVLAVFYQKGLPTYITQAYLVATSVIVAWQLSNFNDWMAWALLIMLAFYDLCAVLTPCGPLKALVKLMSKDDAPQMPGLLYEAQLPENTRRPGTQGNKQNTDGNNNRNTNGNGSDTDTQQNTCSSNNRNAGNTFESNERVPETRQENNTTHQIRRSNDKNEVPEGAELSEQRSDRHVGSERNSAALLSPSQDSASPTTTLPLAIAKIYNLPVVQATSILLDTSSQTAYLHQELSAAELQTNVEARLPRNGGKIKTTRNKRGELRYVVYNRDGEIKRTLFVDEDGKVMEVMPREDDDPADNNIKLGLGDFIFYSVLVSKAAQNGFAPFVACFLSIIAGLGGTLVLLAVYHQALPALPISIFLAVACFLVRTYCMEPWIQFLWQKGPFYM